MKKQTIIILVVAGAVLAVLGVIAVVGIGLVAWLFLAHWWSEPMPAPAATVARPEPSAPVATPETIPPWQEVLPAPLVRAPAAPPQTPAAVDASAWQRHTDPLGFAVQHPAGWKAEATDDGVILIRSPDRKTFALAAPLFVRGRGSAQQHMARAVIALESLFAGASFVREVQKSKTPDVAVASMTYDAGGQRGQAALLCQIADRGGMLFAIAAPADQYAASRPTLVRILQTFQFIAPTAPPRAGAAGAPASIQYTPWQDPNEKAFSLEVPAGWKVSGGLIRRNAVDPRGCVQVLSPEGDVLVSSGDATVPTFSLPTFSQFFPEGSDYSPGYGVVMKVMRYKPGTQFAAEYVQSRLAETFTDIALTGSRDRPDIAQAFNQVYARFAAPVATQLSMGEVTFTCRYQDKPMEGYWFAGTQLTTTNMGDVQSGLWTVPHLIGYVATPPKAPLAQAVMMHMIQSTRLSPQWVGMQQGLTANVSNIVTETNNALSGIIIKGHEARQAVYDDASRKWSNMTLGQTDLVDPDTGQTYKAASGHNYYWVQPGSNAGFGTQTSDPPDINVVPLAEW